MQIKKPAGQEIIPFNPAFSRSQGKPENLDDRLDHGRSW
jgi:hypothetical protein